MTKIRAGVLALAAGLLMLTACSSGAEPAGSSPEGAASASGSAPSAAFPAVIATKFGDVTVAQEPKRIVALGWGDAETALALGVQPVGASDWLAFGAEANGVGPWAQGLYTTPPQPIATQEPSYEAIGALEPDLILDVKGSGDAARHDRLAQIAPTIGVPAGADSYLTNPTQQMEMISTALGQAEQGKTLLAEVDAAFVEAAAAHPEWKGKTVAAATRTSETWGAYIKGSDRVSFLENLGFVQSPKVAEIETSGTGFSVNISSENLDQLDADLIVAFPIFVPTTSITDDPVWQKVPAVADGRAVVIDGAVSSAYSLGTTLASRYAIEQLVPQIEEALG